MLCRNKLRKSKPLLMHGYNYQNCVLLRPYLVALRTTFVPAYTKLSPNSQEIYSFLRNHIRTIADFVYIFQNLML